MSHHYSKRYQLHIAAALLFLLITLFVLTKPAGAIPISPDKYYFDIASDTFIEDTLLIMGRQELEGPTTLYITPVGMRKIGEENEREFYLPAEDDPAEPANWITVETPVIEINPGQEVYVDWTLEATAYAGCGTNLAALMVSDVPLVGEPDEPVLVRKEVISQIHLDIVETDRGICASNKVDLSLDEFKVDKRIPVFWYDEVPFITRISNQGNLISRAPRGYIEISGLGDKITIIFNEDKLDIYPGTTRKFTNMWIDESYPREGTFFEQLLYELGHLRAGRYEAQLGVTKNANPVIIDTAYFWIIPWKVLLVLLAMLLLGLIFRRGGRKKHGKKE